MNNELETEKIDRLIRRRELADLLGLKPDTITKYIEEKRIPPYDVVLSPSAKWWRESTLKACGLIAVASPASRPTLAA